MPVLPSLIQSTDSVHEISVLYELAYPVLTMDGPTVLDDAEAERGDANKLMASVGRRISIHLYKGAAAYAHVCFLRSSICRID